MVYQTRIIKIDQELLEEKRLEDLKKHRAIRLGARFIQEGKVVGFPTETVYGLGADATSKVAVSRIFQAKGRPQDNPLIVHIGFKDQIREVISGDINPVAQKLIDNFWPGPLTIVLNKSHIIPPVTTAGLSSVAIRMPSHPVARALLMVCNIPVAAPSANLSGTLSPTLARHVLHDFRGKIPLIIDGGQATFGIESTVIDARRTVPIVLRSGGVSREELEEVLGFEVQENSYMKYRHYSPQTPLMIIKEKKGNEIREMVERYYRQRIGLILTDESLDGLILPEHVLAFKMGSQSRPDIIASNIFALLRQLDQENLDLIMVEAIPEQGIGRAVMNRLYKASKQE
jgi:L-threonylcarbamoyladenylate synthase